jgi:DNA-binding transcriptional regulator YdaS (Cro superfamily)
MKLSEWLKGCSLTRRAFAKKVGVAPSYITALCDGTVWPGHDVAARIKAATDGEVTPDDFLRADQTDEVVA